MASDLSFDRFNLTYGWFQICTVGEEVEVLVLKSLVGGRTDSLRGMALRVVSVLVLGDRFSSFVSKFGNSFGQQRQEERVGANLGQVLTSSGDKRPSSKIQK